MEIIRWIVGLLCVLLFAGICLSHFALLIRWI
jgi:hypothetical protein